MTSPEQPEPNQKNAQKTHRSKPRASKTHAAYWLSKVRKPAGSGMYGCQIEHQKQRVRFPLATSDKTLASERARDRYLHIVAHGWASTLAKYKPQAVKALKVATVGAWLEAVNATAGFHPRTFTNYKNALRQIASQIEGIGDQPARDAEGNELRKRGKPVLLSRFNSQGGGTAAWAAAVDALPLSVLTPAAVQEWKLAHIDAAGTSPEARRRAENTAASRLRSARSLFSTRAREFAQEGLILPDPLPFAGVKMPKRGSLAYKSKINAPELIATALKELRGQPLKVFALAMFPGLRKGEIDLLPWTRVDFAKAVIRIERTEHFAPKSEEASAEIDIEPELLELLKQWKSEATGEFVIEADRAPRPLSTRAEYRCEAHFQAVYAWLRKHGVTAQKPLHELRKELGAILASEQGIFAAKAVLRHSHISTTAGFYADKKKRITGGLGVLLNAKHREEKR